MYIKSIQYKQQHSEKCYERLFKIYVNINVQLFIITWCCFIFVMSNILMTLICWKKEKGQVSLIVRLIKLIICVLSISKLINEEIKEMCQSKLLLYGTCIQLVLHLHIQPVSITIVFSVNI